MQLRYTDYASIFYFGYLISSPCLLALDSHVGDASMGMSILQKYGVDNLGVNYGRKSCPLSRKSDLDVFCLQVVLSL